MRRIAAIGARGDGPSEAGRTARPAVTAGAAIRQTRANSEHGVDVAAAVAHRGPLTFVAGELALEELPAAPDRPEGITGDQVQRRPGRGIRASPGSDLFLKGLGDALMRVVGCLGAVDHLRPGGQVSEQGDGRRAEECRYVLSRPV